MEIKNRKIEGYLWYSNGSAPIVCSSTEPKDISIDEKQNPFIIEGLLWDYENKTSITIKNIDGKCLIREDDIDKLDEEMIYTEKKIIAHRLKDVKWLKFRQYWKRVSDPECLGMYVLTPNKLVFVGFEK